MLLLLLKTSPLDPHFRMTLAVLLMDQDRRWAIGVLLLQLGPFSLHPLQAFSPAGAPRLMGRQQAQAWPSSCLCFFIFPGQCGPHPPKPSHQHLWFIRGSGLTGLELAPPNCPRRGGDVPRPNS